MGTPPVRMVFDYSYDGVLRSVDESLRRLGLESRRHPLHPRPGRPLGTGDQRGISGTAAAARRGRRGGHRRRHEPGGDAHPLRARDGRWTCSCSPDATRCSTSRRSMSCCRCASNEGIGIVQAGRHEQRHPGRPTARPDLRLHAGTRRWIERAAASPRRSANELDVPLKAAAVQFALAHPQVVSLVAGVRTKEHLDEYPALMQARIPAELLGRACAATADPRGGAGPGRLSDAASRISGDGRRRPRLVLERSEPSIEMRTTSPRASVKSGGGTAPVPVRSTAPTGNVERPQQVAGQAPPGSGAGAPVVARDHDRAVPLDLDADPEGRRAPRWARSPARARTRARRPWPAAGRAGCRPRCCARTCRCRS